MAVNAAGSERQLSSVSCVVRSLGEGMVSEALELGDLRVSSGGRRNVGSGGQARAVVLVGAGVRALTGSSNYYWITIILPPPCSMAALAAALGRLRALPSRSQKPNGAWHWRGSGVAAIREARVEGCLCWAKRAAAHEVIIIMRGRCDAAAGRQMTPLLLVLLRYNVHTHIAPSPLPGLDPSTPLALQRQLLFYLINPAGLMYNSSPDIKTASSGPCTVARR